MASKVWDDLSMWNVDFSQVSSSFDLQRINALELAILGELKYTIKVSASEYAKYYFHLRSMMARLGFHANETSMLLEPLNIYQARKLQIATEKFADLSLIESDQQQRRPRSKTAGVLSFDEKRFKRGLMASATGNDNITTEEYLTRLSSSPQVGKNTLVGIEHLIHSQHRDADGLEHRSRKEQQANLVKKTIDPFSRKAFRTDNCMSWNAGDDEDFKYVRK